MRRNAMLALFTFALALAACGAPGDSESGSAGDASGSETVDSEPTGTAPGGDAAEQGPDTPVSNAGQPEAGATSAATTRRAVDSNPPGDECGASKVAQFVSQKATSAVRARLAAEVGHDRIRWVGPDTVVTMDFRPDRLNVALDENDVITGGKCS